MVLKVRINLFIWQILIFITIF